MILYIIKDMDELTPADCAPFRIAAPFEDSLHILERLQAIFAKLIDGIKSGGEHAHSLAGMTIERQRLQWWAWAVLLASAVIDGLLYLAVRDVVVCYRCGAQHRGLGYSSNRPFELTIQERYRCSNSLRACTPATLSSKTRPLGNKSFTL